VLVAIKFVAVSAVTGLVGVAVMTAMVVGAIVVAVAVTALIKRNVHRLTSKLSQLNFLRL
jgi:hypothetical protein